MEKPSAAFLRHREAVNDSDQEKQGEKPPEKKGCEHWLKGLKGGVPVHDSHTGPAAWAIAAALAGCSLVHSGESGAHYPACGLPES